MGKIAKLLGVPQPMECPHCKTTIEPTRTLAALGKFGLIVGGSVAAAVTIPFLAPFSAFVAFEGARGYVCTKTGVYWRCTACKFEYSKKVVDRAMADGRSKRLKDVQS